MKWIHSSFSTASQACVEAAATTDGSVLVRDSKVENSPILTFTPQEWDAFIAGVKAGEFDL